MKEQAESVISDRDSETGDMMLKLPEKLPGAFVCNSDLTAGLLWEQLSENGYRIPDDFSIVGYDNFLGSHTLAETLTTYDVDMKSIAAVCVKTVRKKLSGSQKRLGIRIIDGHLVERGSVKRKQDE